jgi:hypothetical protein
MTKFLATHPPSIILPRVAKGFFFVPVYLLKVALPNSQDIPYYKG